MSSRKAKRFRASTEVKRQARLRVGVPPPSRRHESTKGKPPKHPKRVMESEKD